MISQPTSIRAFFRNSCHQSIATMNQTLASGILLILWSASLLSQESVDSRRLSEEFTFPTASRGTLLSMGSSALSLSMDHSADITPPLLPACEFPIGQEGPFAGPPGSEADTVQAPPQRKLLPDKMSFVERGLWDETGLMRKIGIAGPLTPDARKRELTARRTMLTIHQIGGFVTLGLMTSAVYCGQQVLNGRRQFRNWHQGLVAGTIASYSVTGLLAVLSPPPLIRRDEVSTTTIHKTLAWVHFVGMVVTPILGATLHHTRTLNYDQTARFHQVSAYVTTAALAASLVVITF
jgi:hypothetical protein